MTDKLSVGQLSNSPMETSIGELKLKIRQLSIKEIFGHFEQKIKSKRIIDAQEMASIMDADTKKDFLIDVWKNLPSGSDLTEMVSDTMASVEGVYDILYLASKDYGSDIEAIKDSIDFNNLQELTPIINWIAGTGNGVEEKNTEVDSEDDPSEKKT